MIRASDLLLTLAAILLLIASLESTAKSNKYIIQASATDHQVAVRQPSPQQPSQPSDMHRERHVPKTSDQMRASFDHLMTKIKKNLDPNSKKLKQKFDNDKNTIVTKQKSQQDSPGNQVKSFQDSYNYYAAEANGGGKKALGGDGSYGPPPADLEATTRQDMMAQQLLHQQRHHEPQYKQAQEVRVDFLRSSSPTILPVFNSNSNIVHNSTTNTLYLLKHILPQLNDQTNDASSAKPANEIDSSEQQQQPPFTMLPPLQQPGSGIPGQIQQLQLLQQQQLQQQRQLQHNQLQQQHQQPNIGQILNNYQRYPQARQLSDYQRQLLTQVQPRPAELHLRPPTQAPALGLVNNPQQPLTPLQLLTGPFQAFLPGLAAQQQQQQQHHQPSTGQVTNQAAGAKAKYDSGTTDEAASPSPAPRSTTQQPQPQQQQHLLSGLLNQFGLQQPPAVTNGRQNQPAAGLPNLQDFYQQLPLYQALLAARQRQEALQAAQRMRTQQQAGGGNSGAGQLNRPVGLGQLNEGSIPLAGNNDATPPTPFAGLSMNPFGAQQGLQPAPGQPSLNGNTQNVWPASIQQRNPILPPPQQTQVILPQQPQVHQQNQPVNQNNPVQFDDDQPNSQQSPSQQQTPTQLSNNNNRDNGSDSNGNGSNNDEQNHNDNQSNNGNHNDDSTNQTDNQNDSVRNNDNSGQQANDHNGSPEQDNQNNNNKSSEEDDPDLKQFQNLANGGDSFTDLFPPGILSNNDISDIKNQQAEQAKKQEEEERQKRQEQQQQQHQQQPQSNNNQPINQFINNNDINTGGPQGVAVNQLDQSNGQSGANNNQAPEQNNDQPGTDGGGEGDQDDSNQQDDGEQNNENESGEDGENGGDGQEESDSPTAAALTAKSSSTDKQTQNGRWTKSPGIKYAADKD